MRIVIPDPLSLKRNHPVNRRNRARRSIDGRPGGPGPITQREVTVPGNVSMYDHLQARIAEAEDELIPTVVWPE